LTLLLSDDEVRQCVDMAHMVGAVEKASIVESKLGEMLMPARMSMNHTEGFLRVMPVMLPGTGVLGLKMFHGSLERGVRYLVILCSITDGNVLAILDAAYLTAARTGAMSGVATDALARHDSGVVGVIGSGLEAETNLMAVCAVRDVREVRVYSRSSERRSAFVTRMQARLGIEMAATATPEEAVAGADIVVVATNTGKGGAAAYQGAWMEPSQHVVSIGSTTPELREIDEVCFARADRVFFDTDAHQVAEESGDIIAADRAGTIGTPHLLADLLCGREAGRSGHNDITLFKSVGSALQDLAGAVSVYEEAIRQGVGTSVADVAALKLF
jgi:ornithine cyclodeaminase/alanine dehydrogenase-like protein (mu-crystallin family)